MGLRFGQILRWGLGWGWDGYWDGVGVKIA
jgi:hypothetical protein